jgi:hypothetical protein
MVWIALNNPMAGDVYQNEVKHFDNDLVTFGMHVKQFGNDFTSFGYWYETIVAKREVIVK